MAENYDHLLNDPTGYRLWELDQRSGKAARAQQVMVGHPRAPGTFEFSETTQANGHTRVIKSHVAYDSRWPWWRRTWADLRGRP